MATNALQANQTRASVASWDGTRIGYRRIGSGPGVVLVQGAMGTQHNFSELAAGLADAFTVYLPDRRGRGLSTGPYDFTYTLEQEVEDLEALIQATGADRVFGLSAGALIVLWAASRTNAIAKVAAFEPPLLLDQHDMDEARARFSRELQDGDLAAAAVTGMLAAQMAPPLVSHMPRRLLKLITRFGLWIESKRPSNDYAPMRELIPALRYDFTVVSEASRDLSDLERINCDVLLIGAEKSPAYLKASLDAVQQLLPQAERTSIPGAGHGAAWNVDRGGKPHAVAPVLRGFFASPSPTPSRSRSSVLAGRRDGRRRLA